jgi:hypothetical protein
LLNFKFKIQNILIQKYFNDYSKIFGKGDEILKTYWFEIVPVLYFLNCSSTLGFESSNSCLTFTCSRIYKKYGCDGKKSKCVAAKGRLQGWQP